jgi:hypothetical protein
MLLGYDPRASRNDNERTSPQVNSVVYWPVGRFIHLCTLRWSDDGLPRPTTADTTIETICSLVGLIPRPGPYCSHPPKLSGKHVLHLASGSRAAARSEDLNLRRANSEVITTDGV